MRLAAQVSDRVEYLLYRRCDADMTGDAGHFTTVPVPAAPGAGTVCVFTGSARPIGRGQESPIEAQPLDASVLN
jgi:hypothetical protein